MLKKIKLLAASFLFLGVPAYSATFSYTNFSGEHVFAGGNVGAGYPSDLAARTDGIALSPDGLIYGSAAHEFEGYLPSVGAGLEKAGRAKTSSNTIGFQAAEAFFISSLLQTEAECIDKGASASGCVPFMGNRGTLRFDFSVDHDATLFLTGEWEGGTTSGVVSLVDFLSISIELVPNQTRFSLGTNGNVAGQGAGLIDGTVNLRAGNTYRLRVNHRAYAAAPDLVGVPVSDESRILLGGTLVETDIASLQAQYNTLAAPVPLPATGLLLLGATGAFGLIRRRRSKGC